MQKESHRNIVKNLFTAFNVHDYTVANVFI